MYAVSGLLSHGDPLWLNSLNKILYWEQREVSCKGKRKKRFNILFVIFIPVVCEETISVSVKIC